MPIEEVTPTSYDELLRVLAEVPSPSTPALSGQFSIFRGVRDSAFSLGHSLSRLNGDLAQKESLVLDDFRDYANTELKTQAIDVDNAWQLMAVAQHHGVPTRLLDWSRHGDTALHFATADGHSMSTEGCVWVVNPHLVHERLPSLIKKSLCGTDETAPGVFRESKLFRVLPSTDALDGQAAGGDVPAFFFEPAWADARIRAQNGLFSVVADVTIDLKSVLEAIPGSARRVLIVPGLKEEVRRKLDAGGRDERCYFPGFDGVSSYLTRKYRS